MRLATDSSLHSSMKAFLSRAKPMTPDVIPSAFHAMLTSTPRPVNPGRRLPRKSNSSIRRLLRQNIMSPQGRNQDTGFVGSMSATRLPWCGRPRDPIGLTLR